MRLFITFKEYLETMRPRSNECFSLGRALAPFGLELDATASDLLLVGHVLDALGEEFRGLDRIDSLDIATCAAELGCEYSEDFLETGPSMIASELGMKSTESVRSNSKN